MDKEKECRERRIILKLSMTHNWCRVVRVVLFESYGFTEFKYVVRIGIKCVLRVY